MFLLVSIQERRGERGEKSGLKGKERKEEEGGAERGFKSKINEDTSESQQLPPRGMIPRSDSIAHYGR